MYDENFNIIKVNEYVTKHKSEFNKEIGLLIKKIRKQKGITIKLVSERTMISETYLKQIESGIYGISLLKFIIICNAIEISPYKIIDDFTFKYDKNVDLFYNILQNDKNISKNIFEFIKVKE